MRRLGFETLIVAGLALGAGLGAAAPAAPSYQAVVATIERVRGDWARPGAVVDQNAPGWNALFDALLGNFQAYAAATTERDRLVALNQLYQISVALDGAAWPPADEIRENLRGWLRPRVRLAWAGRRLVDTIQAMPAAPTFEVQGNRDRWRRFVDNELGQALRSYDAATTVADRRKGLRSVDAALHALEARNQAYPWNPSLELQTAVSDLYNLPNFDISVDVTTLSPMFNVNLVSDGPVYRKGYWSQVTAGPKTGFGLMSSDDGVAFFNRQLLTSVTPIHDFQNQIAGDQRGQRAAKMYQFGATTTDQQELTMVTMIRTSGLELYPTFSHNVGLAVGVAPQPGGGLQRAMAGLMGFGQPRITRMVQQNAIGPMRVRVAQEAAEMGWERSSAEAAQRNATYRKYLIGSNRLAYRDFLIEGLSLRSRPENALVSGLVTWAGVDGQLGADAPKPAALAAPDSGVSADLHVSSIMSNLTRGYLKTPDAQAVQNLTFVTRNVPPGTPLAQGVSVSRNTDYATFLKAVATAQAANDPKVLAVRVNRPVHAPDFAADQKGNLVVLIHDFQVEVPAPRTTAGGATGPPAKVYRLTSPLLELSITFKIEPPSATEPLRLTGRIVGFDPGSAGRIYALQDDDSKPQQLTAFTSALVFGVMRAKLQGIPLNVPLRKVDVPGFALRSVSPLDPSGWIRVVLDRNAAYPAAAAP
jgi:hypothetical protein